MADYHAMGLDLSKEEAFAMVRYPYSPAHMLRQEQRRQFKEIRLEKQQLYWESAGPLRPQTIPFLELPRELRDEIYRAVIPERLALNKPCVVPYIIVQDDRASSGEPTDKSEREYWQRRARGLAELRDRLPILFTNHQVSMEALELVYNERSFHFLDNALHPREMLEILPTLPPTSLIRIRHLQFDVWMFMYTILAEDDRLQQQGWNDLFEFIVNRMHVDSITVELPFDVSFFDPQLHRQPYKHSNDKTPQTRLWDLQSRAYFWPAVRQLVTLLMSGKLRTLRLIHPVPIAVEDVENLDSIRMLRIPRIPEMDEALELDAEIEVIAVAKREQIHAGGHIWKDMIFALPTERPLHDFSIRCEEAQGIYGTTTLELSRRQKD
ncbi:uncharacterized protein BDZ99DRAFT_470261 [Mytilinidion resinicola]|uniref:DUF7730 domain-containing protein n=1 Tax=Mytilinidion resinicola TaxID=574789 RepID=A0A6A6ZAJ6_9PEZI|nr:uncharacterized protein BDZ99DRAFT_470261 [Mytilinidion resinicola]KAF2817227.1 hypothetical protein BDZ99DRAFT_470261 [Mytilinidion resinicola]